MSGRAFLFAAGLIAAVPVYAETPEATAARNAVNWQAFQKLYPEKAVAAHEEGAVGFIVTIDKGGDVTDCRVTHSSGHALLDEETCKFVTLNAVFSPEPDLSPSQKRTREGMIAWKLPESATVLAPPKPVANAAPEKVECRKTVRVGTLAGFERTCLTPTEWARQSDNAKEVWADVQGKKGSTRTLCTTGACDTTLGLIGR